MSELSSLRADLVSTKATLDEALANLTSAQDEIGELRKQLELQTTIGKTEVPCTSEAEGASSRAR
jgi:HAMP domain-containing protein